MRATSLWSGAPLPIVAGIVGIHGVISSGLLRIRLRQPAAHAMNRDVSHAARRYIVVVPEPLPPPPIPGQKHVPPMHSMPSGHISPPPQSSAQPNPPSARIISHTTTAVPVAGGGKQSHTSTQPLMKHVFAP